MKLQERHGAKEFKPSRMSKRHIMIATISGHASVSVAQLNVNITLSERGRSSLQHPAVFHSNFASMHLMSYLMPLEKHLQCLWIVSYPLPNFRKVLL